MSEKPWQILLSVVIIWAFLVGGLVDLVTVFLLMLALIFLMSEIERS